MDCFENECPIHCHVYEYHSGTLFSVILMNSGNRVLGNLELLELELHPLLARKIPIQNLS